MRSSIDRAASMLRCASSGLIPRSSGRRITLRSRSFSTIFRSRRRPTSVKPAMPRIANLLLGRAAEKQICDGFLADDVGHVVAVDHDGRQIELERLGELDSIELLDKDWHHLLAEALDELDHQLAPARHLRMAVHGLASGLEPWLARVAAAMRVTTHIGRPAKAGDA